MSAQLIYRTQDPAALAWFDEALTAQQNLIDTWQAVIVDLTEDYGLVDGEPRALVIREGLVGGFIADGTEPAPAGWGLNAVWRGFVPDQQTAIGARWQNRIDDLPAQESRDSSEIGMPTLIEVIQDGHAQPPIASTLHLPADGGALYALWPDRDIKPLIDAFAADNDAGIAWVEVLRSEWYARLEAYEAAEAADGQ